MAVAYTGTGGLFTRQGALIHFGDVTNTHQANIVTKVDNIQDEYNNDRDISVEMQTGLEGFQSSAGTPLSPISRVMENTFIDMVDDDDPLPSRDLLSALDRLIDNMNETSDSIDGTTVSASTAAGKEDGTSNSGDGEAVVSMTDFENIALQYSRAEDIILLCTADGQETAVNVGRETFSVRGEQSVSNLDDTWPKGSGLSGTINLTDPSVNAGTGLGVNRLTNSDFEDFTANDPDSWTIAVGVAGTDIKKTTTQHRGTNALEFAGDGATLSEITQDVTIAPNRKYVLGFWVRDDGTGPAAGTLVVSMEDSGGNIYNAATSLTTASKSVNLVTVGSIYVLQSVTFETPTDLPAGGTTATIHVALTVALTNTRSAFIDGLFIAEMPQFGGKGGPFIVITPGATDFIREDRLKTTIVNNNEGQFVRGLDRYLDLYTKGLYIPSVTDGSETIDDALVA